MVRYERMAAHRRSLEDVEKPAERKGADGGDAVAYLTFSVMPGKTSRERGENVQNVEISIIGI